jgi:hypothetical protein
MAKINCKKKGSRVELAMAKLLTKITGTQFHRVGVCSGSRFTTQNIQTVGFQGDLFTEDPLYKDLMVEVKGTTKIVSVTDIFNHKSLLWSYIDQCKRECGSKDYLLIVKVNGRTPFYFTPYEMFKPNKENPVIVDVYSVIDKYPKIFENSVPTVFGSWYIGLLK